MKLTPVPLGMSTKKKCTSLKLRIMSYLVDILRTSSPGGSLSARRHCSKVVGEKPGYIGVITR